MSHIRLRRILLGGLAAAALVVPALGDMPPSSSLNVGYTMAFWSIPFGHTTYTGTLSANAYSAKAHFETSGVVGFFWKSVIDATVNGAIGAHSISPALYDSYSRDRDKQMQRVKVTFENDDPATFADPAYDTTKYPVTEAQKKGAVDPMRVRLRHSGGRKGGCPKSLRRRRAGVRRPPPL